MKGECQGGIKGERQGGIKGERQGGIKGLSVRFSLRQGV